MVDENENFEVADWVAIRNNRGKQFAKVIKVNKTTLIVHAVQYGKLGIEYKVKRSSAEKIDPSRYNLEHL